MVQKFNETDEALPPRSSGCGSFLYGAMSKFVRVLGLAVLPLLVVLVTPSAFAQSWISAVTATTTTTTAPTVTRDDDRSMDGSPLYRSALGREQDGVRAPVR